MSLLLNAVFAAALDLGADQLNTGLEAFLDKVFMAGFLISGHDFDAGASHANTSFPAALHLENYYSTGQRDLASLFWEIKKLFVF